MDLTQIQDKLFQVCKDYEMEKENNTKLRGQLQECEGRLTTALHLLSNERRKRKDNDEHYQKTSEMNKIMRCAIVNEQKGIEVSSEQKHMYLRLMFTSPQKNQYETVQLDELRSKASQFEGEVAYIKSLLGVSSNKLELITARRTRFIRAYQGKEKFTPKKQEPCQMLNVESVKRDLFNDDWDDDVVDEMLCACLDDVDGKSGANVDTFDQKVVEGADVKPSKQKAVLDGVSFEEAEKLLDGGEDIENGNEEEEEKLLDDVDNGKNEHVSNDNKMQADVNAFNILMK